MSYLINLSLSSDKLYGMIIAYSILSHASHKLTVISLEIIYLLPSSPTFYLFNFFVYSNK